jgi:hypothetical protein
MWLAYTPPSFGYFGSVYWRCPPRQPTTLGRLLLGVVHDARVIPPTEPGNRNEGKLS